MSDKLRLAEMFMSYQGEGVNVGQRALFIRFAGCNLRCPWCDTKYAWSQDTKYAWSDKDVYEYDGEGVYQLIRERYYPDSTLTRFDSFDVCITGGEPLTQPIHELYHLCQRLWDSGHVGHTMMLETNGTIPNPPQKLLSFFDTITVSPKLATTGVTHGYDTDVLQQYVDVVSLINNNCMTTRLVFKYVVDVSTDTNFYAGISEIQSIHSMLHGVNDRDIFLMAEGVGTDSINNTRRLIELVQKSASIPHKAIRYSISPRMQAIMDFK